MNSKLFNSDPKLRKEFINFLSECIFERRLSQIQKVLENRTRYITVVLEDIYQSQNASAVLRTCDCLGIQDIHIIENKNKFNINPQVVMGASKWLTIKRHKEEKDNTINAINSLKAEGYRIVATTPHTNVVNLEDFDLSKGKFALFFGTENTGLTEDVLNKADEFVKIPMVGFTESFNISVSAAISLYFLTNKLRSSDLEYHLQEDESELLLLSWLKASTRNWPLMEKRFLSEYYYKNQKNTCHSI
ncbi:MAG: TrmH family RNA methyltransferase [Tenuifilaceae bacterium]